MDDPGRSPNAGTLPIATAAIRPAPEERHPAAFTGTTAEYFRIWIVNLALTVLTLGIYSAWAKVRKRRYFYAHTRIAGESFEYRARPLAILKGRAIALALLLVLIAAGNLVPELSLESVSGKLLFFVAAVFLGPWLVVRSLKFHAASSAYRNLRFRFLGTYAGCLRIVALYVWLVFFAILYPWFKHRLVRYAAEHHAYGTTQFEVGDFKKPFLHAYAVAFGLGLLAGIPAVFLLAAIGLAGGAFADAVPVVTYGGFLLLYAFVRARTTNAVWNAIRVGPLRFQCTMRGRDYMWIYLSNVLAILFSLGFATPWAVIRTLRYRAARFAVIASGPLDGFRQAAGAGVGATGQEVAELFDLDLGL